jgi:hypothetical protein
MGSAVSLTVLLPNTRGRPKRRWDEWSDAIVDINEEGGTDMRIVAAAYNQHWVVQALQIAADPVADDIEEAGIVVHLRIAANGIVED